MKTLLIVVLVVSLSGCLAEVLTVTAIQGELAAENAQSAMRALEHTRRSVSRIEVNSAVQAYAAEHGRNPPSLHALVPAYLPEVPTAPNGQPLAYDPSTGTVYDSSVPPMTARDDRNLQAISDAIYLYWQSSGNYPGSLDALAPLYMNPVPRMATGGPYVYNPRSGAVNHPAELQQFAAGASNTGRSDTRGLHRQLQNRSTSGASGTALRQIGGAADMQSRRQLEILNDQD